MRPIPFGQYLLLERINVGGMAEVYIAKTFGVEGFERLIALKRILPALSDDAEIREMFADEARICSQLAHSSIVQTLQFGREGDTYFLAMEYVPGLELKALLEWFHARGERMPMAMAAYITTRICEGLDYAHRKRDTQGREMNIVHRDVSPQNVIVSFDGEVKLIDFGIAKANNRAHETQVGILKGKFAYMSPEQVRSRPLDRRSDVFSAGILLYEMITGETLFIGESDYSLVERVALASVPPMRELNAMVPDELDEVVATALARSPGERYQWASDLQEALMPFLLVDGELYTSKHLARFMQEAFDEERELEADRMKRYEAVKRPDSMEVSRHGPAPRAPIVDPEESTRIDEEGPVASSPPAQTRAPDASLARSGDASAAEPDGSDPEEPTATDVERPVLAVGAPSGGEGAAPADDESSSMDDDDRAEADAARAGGDGARTAAGTAPSDEYEGTEHADAPGPWMDREGGSAEDEEPTGFDDDPPRAVSGAVTVPVSAGSRPYDDGPWATPRERPSARIRDRREASYRPAPRRGPIAYLRAGAEVTWIDMTLLGALAGALVVGLLLVVFSLSEPGGGILARTDPEGAYVYVDGKSAGVRTPLTEDEPLRLEPGRREIRFLQGNAVSRPMVVEVPGEGLVDLGLVRLDLEVRDGPGRE